MPLYEAAAPTRQQHATNAIRVPSSMPSAPLSSLRIRSLTKTIIVPLTIFLVFTNLVVPVAAMDNQIALAPYPVPSTYGIFTANPPPRFPIRVPLDSIGMMAFIVVGYMMTVASQMLGPLMGVTSVMSFILRNDPAVQPSISWTYVSSCRLCHILLISLDRIFGIWSIATMMYLRCQTRRVKLDSL